MKISFCASIISFFKSSKRNLFLPLLLSAVFLIFFGCNKDGPNISVPVLTTTAANIITHATAQSGANISSDGGAAVTARGICWNTSPGPTLAASKTTNGSGTGNFKSWLTGLAENTTYYVRAYATNSSGTGYGNEISFKSQPVSATNVTDIDGNIYDIMTIGTQVWMKANLKATHYRNGDTILNGLDNAAWGTTTMGVYASYANDPANDNVYGKLYNWYAAVDTRNIAPAGWHVPSEAEWNELIISALGGLIDAGGKMKEAGLTHWNSPNSGATNSSGFTGLPGGYRSDTGQYDYLGNFGYWWSTTGNGSEAEVRALFYNQSEVGQTGGKKAFGISIRCVKD